MRALIIALLLAGCGTTTTTTTTTTNATTTATATSSDYDGDGVTTLEDCDDDDALVGSATDWYIDTDGDGYGVDSASTRFACEGDPGYVDNADDCDDGDDDVYPGADEICDGYDNNCDDLIDGDDAIDGSEYCYDGDGDGYGDELDCTTSCAAPTGYADNSGDCDDTDAEVGTWGDYDNDNCGACFNACDEGTNCISGECAEECIYPDIDMYDGTYDGSSTFAPYYFGISYSGFMDNSTLNDGYIDGTESSATLGFTFYDVSFNVLCTLYYDASNSTPAAHSSYDGATLLEGWNLTIADGITDCVGVDAAIYGVSSVFDLMEQFTWGISFGPMSATYASAFQVAVEDAGLNWATDWAPYVSTMSVSLDGVTAQEIDYVFRYQNDCDDLNVDGSGYYPTMDYQTTAPLNGFYSAQTYYVYSFF